MIEVETQLARVLAEACPLPSDTVPLAAAHGRVIAETVVSRYALPPWTNSAMDGYAVRSEDVASASETAPVSLEVIADLPAGTAADPVILPGQAARIMTGAPVPADADAIVPVEATDGGELRVTITAPAAPGVHIRSAGEDRQPGDALVSAGSRAGAEVLSALASAGFGRIKVARRPRVAVIATGSELVAPGEPLDRGQIPDSNSLLISSLAVEHGAELVDVVRVSDEVAELETALRGLASRCDVIVLTGGVSMGAYDPVKELLSPGEQVRFEKVAMQPGKPQGFGRLAAPWVDEGELGPLVFGLPGNPVSAWVSFLVFVRPCLRALQGASTVEDPKLSAHADVGWRTPPGRRQYLPARIRTTDAGVTVSPAAARGSGSHLVGSLADANGYAVVDASIERVQAGDVVQVVRLVSDVDARL
ncbi:molybdopterin molybdenumtransferase MoeA [Pseudoclavibacter sp. AY1F1]|uniref:molybdopterin molybdotransferase MoeA n=1 Tax=Pseudoclavibacter sp. AY1F1 TaxID=2080583 RepID=UPI000CE7F28E|nr:gephyrin-like molybdotransferase Glp [Pseudoclavibacter sp. AY1F1]PPF44910.1 molybdopterin molybdenumtransferase MoeA [Pseudoclavibacter sp. AY1F1]